MESRIEAEAIPLVNSLTPGLVSYAYEQYGRNTGQP